MKKILSFLFVSLFVLGSSFVGVNAEENLDVSALDTHECIEGDCCESFTIQPRMPLYTCLNCGSRSTVTSYYSTGDWKAVGTVDCEHYDYGVDVTQRRTVTYKVTCNTCGNVDYTTSSEVRVICRGYN